MKICAKCGKEHLIVQRSHKWFELIPPDDLAKIMGKIGTYGVKCHSCEQMVCGECYDTATPFPCADLFCRERCPFCSASVNLLAAILSSNSEEQMDPPCLKSPDYLRLIVSPLLLSLTAEDLQTKIVFRRFFMQNVAAVGITNHDEYMTFLPRLFAARRLSDVSKETTAAAPYANLVVFMDRYPGVSDAEAASTVRETVMAWREKRQSGSTDDWMHQYLGFYNELSAGASYSELDDISNVIANPRPVRHEMMRYHGRFKKWWQFWK